MPDHPGFGPALSARARRLRPALPLLAALLLGAPAAAAPAPDRVQAGLAAAAASARPGQLGAAVEDLRTGQIWAVDGESRFGMQSVFKLPLAIALFAKVDSGLLSLDRKLVLGAGDMRPGYGPIAKSYRGRPLTTNVRALIEAMLVDSDNTAGDALLPLAGGPAGVTRFLRAHGLDGLRVDRSELELANDYGGLAWHGSGGAPWRAALGRVPEARRRQAAVLYLRDPRDTATPRGAIRLLDSLVRGRLLSSASTATLLGIMSGARTGEGRLKAGLPAGSRIAHKTGSAATTQGVNAGTNDIGIVTLPSGRIVLVAAFLKASTAGEARRDAILADVARTAARGLE